MMWKRRFKRLSILAMADLQIGRRKPLKKAYVANITQAGIGLYVADLLPIGSRVTVTLHFVSHEGKVLNEKVQGKVVWCQEAFATGIALKPLTKKEHPRLVTFLEALGGADN